jgi:hypothetical protein
LKDTGGCSVGVRVKPVDSDYPLAASIPSLTDGWTCEAKSHCIQQVVPGNVGNIRYKWVLVEEELHGCSAFCFRSSIDGVSGDDGFIKIRIIIEQCQDGKLLRLRLCYFVKSFVITLHLGNGKLEVCIQVQAVGDLVIDSVCGIQNVAKVEARASNTPKYIFILGFGSSDDSRVREHQSYGDETVQD